MLRHIRLAAMFLMLAGNEAAAQAPPCTGLCLQQVQCAGGATTSVSGKIYAPNATDPLPNVFVYVPNGGTSPTYGVQAFAAGVQTSAPVSGSPLVQTKSTATGSFTLTNMPVGANIPLVVQAGKWRRMYTIPNVTACVNTSLPAIGTRFPIRNGEFTAFDHIPDIAVVTGAVDALECSLRKIGISDTSFSDPPAQGGSGSVDLYLGNAPSPAAAGAMYSANTPSETQLFSTQANLNQYDIAMLACQSSEDTPTAAADNTLVTFAGAGGHVFAMHSNYPWLSTYSPFSGTAVWNANQTPPTDPQTAIISTTFPSGQLLAQWLKNIGASSTLGQISLSASRHDLSSLVAPTQQWMSINSPSATMQFTFNTPVGQPATQQYGFVLYHDYHMVDQSSTPTTGKTFPSECPVVPMTPQEKVLEYDLFALAWTALPTVTGISPNAGSTAGGTAVTITGNNLVAASAVMFGANAATSFTTNLAGDTIYAVAPAGSAGTVDVVVTTPAGTTATSAADHFTYALAPAVTSISPSVGPTAGGSSVTITGANFSGATAVDFGATPATTFTVNSATSISATAPAGTGTVDVVVTTGGGSSATSAADQFTFSDPPTVTNVSPSYGPTAGGTSVTITGTNFADSTAVSFGATPAVSPVLNSPTSITATSPAGTGIVDVVVTNPAGDSAVSSADQFTYVAAPTVTSISPTSGSTAGGTSVTITGTAFSGATAVTFGATAASGFNVNDATSITATAPAGNGTIDVVVTTAGGNSATSAADRFTYRTTSSVTLTTNCPLVFVAGQNFSATATVAGSAPTGTVNFLAGGNGIANCTGVALNAASANCMVNNLPIGEGAMTATYGGDANNLPSASAGMDLTILDPANVIWRNSFEEAIAGCPTE